MKIEYKRLYEQVIIILKNKIEEGEFAVGEKLPSERDLVKELDVSRGTLRDAFRVLESQGVIETKPGGGRVLTKAINDSEGIESKFIDEMKRSAILELIEAREIVETGIIDLVCEHATDEELEELENLLNHSEKETIVNNSNDFIFHYSLAKYSNNNVLINFMELNLNLINEARKIKFDNEQYKMEAHQEHNMILTALMERDADKAKKAMANHSIKIKQRMGRK